MACIATGRELQGYALVNMSNEVTFMGNCNILEVRTHILQIEDDLWKAVAVIMVSFQSSVSANVIRVITIRLIALPELYTLKDSKTIQNSLDR